jgi:hypothetical protein
MKYNMTILLIAVIVLRSFIAEAQVYDRTIIHAGDSASDYYSYRFPSFSDAQVKMKDGRSMAFKMNFNMLLCEMQFINDKGDTLVIAKPEEIASIRLRSSLFYFDKNYYEVVAASDSVKLVVLRKVSFEPVKLGPMGARVQSAGIDEYNAIATERGRVPLHLNEDIYAEKTTTNFLVGADGEMVVANKAAWLKAFAVDKKNFDLFIKSNKINLNKLKDLETLFTYCMQFKT